MKFKYYDRYINKQTRGRNDITPLFEHPEAFLNLVNDLLKPFLHTHVDKIASLDALGFVLGGAMALKRKVGLVCIRKRGKLPGIKNTVLSSKPFRDYSKDIKSLEINKTTVKKGEKILLVDEWIETGMQMTVAIQLIEKLGGIIVGITTLCAHKNRHTKLLFDRYNLHAITVFDDTIHQQVPPSNKPQVK